MKVLIIGSGGREHALAWKLKQSPQVSALFITPGNAGTAECGTNLDIEKMPDILMWLKKNHMDLVVIGPDNYLADGLSDRIRDLHIPVFAPSKAASEIEWSKRFAKKLMHDEGIPTAAFKTFSDFSSAATYVHKQKMPIVIKANGLAFGKGVTIAETVDEAIAALNDLMQDKNFGPAGAEVVVEEFLPGYEFSVHAFCDGDSAIMFPSSKDHKRIFEDDQGPNTGGMGAIAPLPGITERQLEEIRETIVLPTLRALKKRGTPFVGILYPGIMMTPDGPKVIEFNARFGDPETQSYMRLLESDLIDIMRACIDHTLDRAKIVWSSRSACCIVLASDGYPGNYARGKEIALPTMIGPDIVIFHAATKKNGDAIITNGGRVLNITATGEKISEALEKAYIVARSISFDGMQYRRDIGAKL